MKKEEKMAKNFIEIVLRINENLREIVNSLPYKDEFIKSLIHEVSSKFTSNDDIADIEWFIEFYIKVTN